MMVITTTTLLPCFAVLARVAGLAIVAPIFGSPFIPKIVRIAIVLVLGFSAWTMTANIVIGEVGYLGFGLILAGEFAIGATIGFLMTIPLIAIQMGGSLMGQQMSLALPSMLDPSTGGESDELGRAFMMFAIVSFVVVGGIEQTYMAVVGSFEHLPIAALTHDSMVSTLTGMLDTAFEFGLRVALPLIAVLMIQTAALAMIARSMPQLNIFSVGLPVRILIGMTVLIAGLSFVGVLMGTMMPGMVGSVSDWALGTVQ